jgi:hypothetical protein
MKYVFTINKNPIIHSGFFDSPEEAFENAVICATEAISSILYDEGVQVKYSLPKIIISSNEGALPFTLSECKNRIKAVFHDENGNTYPEFLHVKATEIC